MQSPHSFSFRIRPKRLSVSSASAKKVPCFQHNDTIPVTPSNYAYVRSCKQRLVREVTTLLDRLGIRFVLSHGNLLEWVRGRPIYHDDDVDLRFHEEDLPLWQSYLDAGPENWKPPGLHIRAANRRQHFYKVELVWPTTTRPRPFTVVLDLVVDRLANLIWVPYDKVNFDARRVIEYLGVRTYAPSEEDTNHVLTLDYGPHYLVPDRAAPRWAVDFVQR